MFIRVTKTEKNMKIIKFLPLLFIVLAISSCGGKKENNDAKNDSIPEAVTQAFNKEYPTAKNVVWEIEGDVFEVEFTISGKELEASFDKTGKSLADDDGENEVEINPADLSQGIKEDIESRYPGAKLLEADEITLEDGSNTYDVEIDHNGEVFEVMYDSDAKFLGIEEDDDDGDEDDD